MQRGNAMVVLPSVGDAAQHSTAGETEEPAVNAVERELLLRDLQGPLRESYWDAALVYQQFAAAAAAHPARPCLVQPPGSQLPSLSYAETAAAVGRLAVALRALRLPASAPVGLLLERSAEWAVAMLAALATGHPFVPMEPSLPQGRLSWYLQDARPAALLCAGGTGAAGQAQELLAASGEAGRHVGVMQVDCAQLLARGGGWGDGEAAAGSSRSGGGGVEEPCEDTDAVAYILFTSGSTGRPKGAAVTQGGLRDLVEFFKDAHIGYALGQGDVSLAANATTFDMVIGQVLAPAAVGTPIVLVPPGKHIDFPFLAQLLLACRVTFWFVTPAVMRECLLELRARKQQRQQGQQALGGQQGQQAEAQQRQQQVQQQVQREGQQQQQEQGSNQPSQEQARRGYAMQCSHDSSIQQQQAGAEQGQQRQQEPVRRRRSSSSRQGQPLGGLRDADHNKDNKDDDEEEDTMPAVRIVLVGGEQWTTELANVAWEVLPRCERLVNFYGPTECTVGTVCGDVPRGATRMFIGRPDANVHAYVVGERMQLLPLGSPGELLLSGPRLAAGYVGRPDLTADRFVANPFLAEVARFLPPRLLRHYERVYRTGDLVAWKRDGARGFQVEVLGRMDRQLKINGVRMELAEVEAALAGAPGVIGSVVAVKTAATGKDILVAYVKPETVKPEEFCRSCLLPAMLPAVVWPLPAFPLNPSGKIDMAALPDPTSAADVAGPEAGGGGGGGPPGLQLAYVAPASREEAVVQRVWGEVLGLQQPLSVAADYFASGGTSLQLFRLAARMQEELRLPQPVLPTLIYTTRTICGTAQALAEGQEGSSSSSSRAGEAGGLAGTVVAGRSATIVRRLWKTFQRPLSAGQQQMWLLQQAGLGQAYNMQMAMSLQGPVNNDALRAAFQAVIDRHEVLRMRIVEKADGSLVGEVLPVGAILVPLRVVACSDSQQEQRAALQAEMRAAAFDLGRPPLLRVLLMQHGPERHTMAVVMHHAVGDAWSFGLLFQEVSAAYNSQVVWGQAAPGSAPGGGAAVSAGDSGSGCGGRAAGTCANCTTDSSSLGSAVELAVRTPRRLAAPAAPLAPLPIQYADFARWQQDTLGGGGVGAGGSASPEAERLRQFWRKQLEGAVPMLQLPLDRPRPLGTPSYAAGRLCCHLGEDLTQGVARLAATLRVSVQAVLLAALQLVLLRYSHQEEVTVGVPTAGRVQPETHPLIGYFVNPLPIRTTPHEGTTFAGLARQVARSLGEALAHSALPLQQVLEAAAVPRLPGVNPLFQVMFQAFGEGELTPVVQLEGVRASPLPAEALADAAKVKFELYIQVDAKGSLEVEYMAELFDAATVEGLVGSLKVALGCVTANPEVPAADVPLLGEGDARALLARFAWRAPLRPEFLSGPLAHQLFEAAAAEEPAAKCLEYEGAVLTYQQVNQRANRLAHTLIQEGVRPDVPVALLIDRSPDYVISLLATLKAGGCFVPLDPSYPQDRLAACVEDASPVLLISQAQHAQRARSLMPGALAGKVLLLEEFWGSNPEGEEVSSSSNPTPQLDPSNLAYLLFTSGSTGRPKGAMITHRGLADFARGAADSLGLTSADVGLLNSSCAFDAHITQLLSITTGGRLVIPTPQGHTDPRYMAGLLRQAGVTWLLTVPSLALLYLEELAPLPCYTLRMLVPVGEALPRKLMTLAHSFLPHLSIVNGYGPTEATVQATVAYLPWDPPVITVGYPDPNVHCYIVQPRAPWQSAADTAAAPPAPAAAGSSGASAQPAEDAAAGRAAAVAAVVPVGVPGELLLSGPRLGRGYVGCPDLTAAAWVPNPCFEKVAGHMPEQLRPCYKLAYRTGDLARWLPDGSIEYLGRLDQQVKIDGVRIEVGEIEAVLASAPGVALAAVSAQVLDGGGRKRLVAYVTPATVDLEAVKAHCRAKLTGAMVPPVIVPLEAMPLLPSGKVNRRALPAPPTLGAQPRKEEPYVAPKDDVEAVIQEVATEVLGLERALSVTADFFAAGGSSLKAGVIQARLRERLGVPDLPGNALMQNPSIKQLAQQILEAKARRAARRRVPKPIMDRAMSTRSSLLLTRRRSQPLTATGTSTSFSTTSCELCGKDHLSAEDLPLPAFFSSAISLQAYGSFGNMSRDGSARLQPPSPFASSGSAPISGPFSAAAAAAPPAAPAAAALATLPSMGSSGSGLTGVSRTLSVPRRRLPYAAYLVLQYLLLVLANTPQMVSWLAMLLLLTLAYRAVGTGWLVLLWLPIYGVDPVVNAGLAILYTWLLLPRGLHPGVHPVYGWLHARWAAARAVQRLALSQAQLLPYLARTPLLPLLYRALGAKIGKGVMLDTGSIQDPQLVNIGEESRVGFDVKVAGAMMVPAGIVDPDQPALVFSQVCVGDGCHVGHKAVLPAGARLKDGFHLRPRAAPSHPGAVGKGVLADTPEFAAEEHLGRPLTLLCAVLGFVMHTLAMLPGMCATFAIMAGILGDNPFHLLDRYIFRDFALGVDNLEWRLVVWPPLFSALFQVLVHPAGTFCHTLLLVAFKRLVVGRLPPGTCLLRSRWLLFRYALFCRMLEDAYQDRFKKLVASTTLIADLYRWLGASVGSNVFLGDFNATCHDSLVIGDMVATGCSNRVYGVDAGGTVRRVVMEKGVTVGNSTVMYPGCRLEENSLLGNDSVLPAAPPGSKEEAGGSAGGGGVSGGVGGGVEVDLEAGLGGEGGGGGGGGQVKCPQANGSAAGAAPGAGSPTNLPWVLSRGMRQQGSVRYVFRARPALKALSPPPLPRAALEPLIEVSREGEDSSCLCQLDLPQQWNQQEVVTGTLDVPQQWGGLQELVVQTSLAAGQPELQLPQQPLGEYQQQQQAQQAESRVKEEEKEQEPPLLQKPMQLAHPLALFPSPFATYSGSPFALAGSQQQVQVLKEEVLKEMEEGRSKSPDSMLAPLEGPSHETEAPPTPKGSALLLSGSGAARVSPGVCSDAGSSHSNSSSSSGGGGSGGSDGGASKGARENGHDEAQQAQHALNGEGPQAAAGAGGGSKPHQAERVKAVAPPFHAARVVLSMLVVLPIAPVLRWSVMTFAVVLVANIAGWPAIAVYVCGLGGGLALATLWLRLLPSLVGMYRYWEAGRAPVTSITAAITNNNLHNPIYDILLDTPFMAAVGKRVLVTGFQPVEIPHVSIGDGAVVESSAFVEGHYIEAMHFNYQHCSVGERAWVQQGSRVMPGVRMGAGARLLPGCTVLPGEALGDGTLWGGGVPANPLGSARKVAVEARESVLVLRGSGLARGRARQSTAL
ncbi:hypothetical protein N2152v2_004404 [Parachlorella kessleri]